MSEIDQLLSKAIADLDSCEAMSALEDLRVHYLGKKGLFTEQLKSLGFRR